VRGHANDLRPARRAHRVHNEKTPPDCGLVGPQLTRQPLVDDDERLAVVSTRERSSGEERHAQRLEVSSKRDESLDLPLLGFRPERYPLRHRHAGQRRGKAHTRTQQPGRVAHFVDELLIELAAPGARFVECASPESRAGERDEQRCGAMRIEAERDGSQADERPCHQAGADEQHDGQGELRRDQHSTRDAGSMRAVLLQPTRDVRSGCMPGRYEARHQCGRNGKRDGEQRDRSIDRDRLAPRQGGRGESEERVDAPLREQPAGRGADRTDDPAFRQKLTDNAAA